MEMTWESRWGFDEWLKRRRDGFAVPQGLAVGRIVSGHGDYYHLVSAVAGGELLARKKKSAFLGEDAVKPLTGDFVLFRHNPQGEGMICEVLPRFSRFERRDPTARRKAQTLAVNFDTIFIVMSASAPFSPARLERFLALAGDMGDAEAVLAVSKADLAPPGALDAFLEGAAAGGIAAAVFSSKTAQGLESVREYAKPGRTVALVGASGVGKSSLVNALAQEEWMATQEVQEWSGKGRHTTTSRELVMLPDGAMILDTPGVREIGLVGEVDFALAKGVVSHRIRKPGGNGAADAQGG